MKVSPLLINNYNYKKLFLPNITKHDLFNHSQLQCYRIEHYLKQIIIPINPYQISFNFLILITRGFVRQQLNEEVFEVHHHESLMVKQGDYTATLALSPDVEGFFIVYENEVVDKIALSHKESHLFHHQAFFQLDQVEAQWLIRLITCFEEELHHPAPNPIVCTALFESLLFKILHTSSVHYLPPSQCCNLFFQFKKLVHKNHVAHKEVGYYAQALKVSDHHLHKCVKNASGKPPKTWINEISILHGQMLLHDSSKEIAQIAFELNYDSPSYFCRLFKKMTGLTPSAFRAAHER